MSFLAFAPTVSGYAVATMALRSFPAIHKVFTHLFLNEAACFTELGCTVASYRSRFLFTAFLEGLIILSCKDKRKSDTLFTLNFQLQARSHPSGAVTVSHMLRLYLRHIPKDLGALHFQEPFACSCTLLRSKQTLVVSIVVEPYPYLLT